MMTLDRRAEESGLSQLEIIIWFANVFTGVSYMCWGFFSNSHHRRKTSTPLTPRVFPSQYEEGSSKSRHTPPSFLRGKGQEDVQSRIERPNPREGGGRGGRAVVPPSSTLRLSRRSGYRRMDRVRSHPFFCRKGVIETAVEDMILTF